MEKYAADLLAQLHYDLQIIAMESENHLQQFEQSYYKAEATMRQLKDYIQSYKFKDTQQEILFFKEIKPLIHKEVIYYLELYYIESDKPIGSEQNQKQYYGKVIERMMDYFDHNRGLYNYYRGSKVNMDETYFLRGKNAIPLLPGYVLEIDQSFSTPYSLSLAQIQAYEQVCEYLNTVVYGSEVQTETASEKKKKKGITWSATKAALIELAIALYYSGSVNFGQGGLKFFISELESFFNIQLGNVYRVFLGMVIRKKDQTPFLTLLVETAKRKLDEKSM